MERELIFDEASLTGAARRMREAADRFGQNNDALLVAITGSGRSPWGSGVIGMAMDQINEILGQACGHLDTNLGKTSASMQEMADRMWAAESAIEGAVHVIGQNLDYSAR